MSARAAWMFSLVLTLVATNVTAQRQAQPEVHITRVEGPIARSALRRLFAPSRFADCQSTLMGGPLRLALHVEPSGAVVIDEAHANEEIDVYVPCVQRVVAGLHAEAQPQPTSARVTIGFPPVGLAP